MAQASTQFSFLETMVLEMLRAKGFDRLSPADQEVFLPQFTAEAERRLGVALMPYLNNEAAMAEFNKLAGADTSAGAWFTFWNSRVPKFDEVVKKALEDFANEVAAAFAM